MFEEQYLNVDMTLQQRNNQGKCAQTSESSHLKQFLKNLDQNHDSEDEGIEDYNIGGYHPVHIGQVLINRYVIIQKLGWGHFSTVWLCKDFKHDTYVAIKIQKSSPHYMQAAFDEVQILQRVQTEAKGSKWDGSRDDTHVVGLLNAFIHKTYYGNHFCMVFQILRCNLLDIIKRYNYQGVPLDICQEISTQILKGLDYLHRVCGVIHTDLKPENVMVCLSDQEVKQLVQNGQLSSHQLFAQRMKTIQQIMGIQPKNIPSLKKPEKIQEIEVKLKCQNLSKNQKKNLRKKLKRELQKENINNKETTETQQMESQPCQQIRMQDLFDMKKGKIKFNRGQKLRKPFRIKIADLGNACWKHHHFSTQIQTRQYRSPQVILGQHYTQTSDIWSFGCMMYQMLTGDLLFQPRKTESWGKNDDHLAQMQELIGNFNPLFIARSPKRFKYFNRDGKMKRMPDLCHYPLSIIMQMKYRINQREAQQFAHFIQTSLVAEPELRASAQQMLQNDWLQRKLPNHYKMNERDYEELSNKFNQNEQGFQYAPKNFLSEEPEEHLLSGNEEQRETEEERCADIRLVDRSFTDLGYIGYSDGIELGELDCQGNWQFT